MANLTDAELETVFDFLEIKRGVKLGCWVCGSNEWSARKVPEVIYAYVQLICKNCKQVVWFTNKVLNGI